jgi:hypothetical protein
MTSPGSSSDTQEALRVLERDRAELAALTAPVADQHDAFPRSATFRWLAGHISGRSLGTAAGALLLRVALRRLLRAAVR